ncbi:hypothetical protein [Streptomyces netropsis]|uniref:Phage-related protein n=1 Tax=Streptomyces netropsis TaxID=55404 RepID=A0A7W7L8T2_STRNE|nr:hypothetical protein [Streptomyces netropsis]MBB4885517.1 hypothetical protein [Streptomyces netropsis]GGR38711.1 hypothetical protein GCM10010219_49830 [Streptomyces netropsis]
MSPASGSPATPPPVVTRASARPGRTAPAKLKAVAERRAPAPLPSPDRRPARGASPGPDTGSKRAAAGAGRPARPTVGNAATAALAARRAAAPAGRVGEGKAGRAPTGERGAKAAPGLRRIAAEVTAAQRLLTRHPTPDAEAEAARCAAVPPPGERAALAGPNQADAIARAQVKPFDRAEFIARFERRIEKQKPVDAQAAKDLADPNRQDTFTPELSGEVRAAADTSTGEVRATAATPPDPSGVPERPPVPLVADRPPPAPAPPRAADAVPPRLPDRAVDLSPHACATTAEMNRAGLSEETLRRANEPAFSAALASKEEAEKDTALAPGAFRAGEAQQRAAAEQRAAGVGKTAMAAMAGIRVTTGKAVTGGKESARARTQARRTEITARLEEIYAETKRNVEAALAGLDDVVRTHFDTKAKEARQRFLDACARSWWDFLTGEPDYVRHSARYTAEIRTAVDEIAALVERRVREAREKAADGRRRMTEFVKGLDRSVQAFGEEAAAGFAARFDELETSVDERADAAVDRLAEAYTQAQQETDAALTELKESNKSLWERARDAVAGAVKILLDLKNLLIGVVKRAAGVAQRIVTRPIDFLRNLGASVEAGLTLFLSNIVTHLKAALQEWLFGNLAAAGVELPERWDLRGIVKTVLSLFGISWAFIRSELLKHMPESVLNTVIGAVKVLGLIKDKGVGALWEEIRETIGDLRQQAFEMIKSFVVETVLKAGITWLLSLITPAGALVKAVMAVYDFLTFLVEKARALAEFVNSILDTLEDICDGVSQKVTTKIESSLARTLPIAIDLFARVLRLGAVPAKVKEVLGKVGAPVRGFVSKVIAQAAAVAKRLLAGGARALGGVDRRTDAERAKDRDAAVAAGVKAVNLLGRTPLTGRFVRITLTAIRVRFRVRKLWLKAHAGHWWVAAENSAEVKEKTDKELLTKQQVTALADQAKKSCANAAAIHQSLYKGSKGTVVVAAGPTSADHETQGATERHAEDFDKGLGKMTKRERADAVRTSVMNESMASAFSLSLDIAKGRDNKLSKAERHLAALNEGAFLPRPHVGDRTFRGEMRAADAEIMYYHHRNAGGSVKFLGVSTLRVCPSCTDYFITRARKENKHIAIGEITGHAKLFRPEGPPLDNADQYDPEKLPESG